VTTAATAQPKTLSKRGARSRDIPTDAAPDRNPATPGIIKSSGKLMFDVDIILSGFWKETIMEEMKYVRNSIGNGKMTAPIQRSVFIIFSFMVVRDFCMVVVMLSGRVNSWQFGQLLSIFVRMT
jgi:hypothetical protein